MPEVIRRVNGYAQDAYTYYPVVIVGAGESGIAIGCSLKEKLGFDQFRIFDRQAGIGGTWWINRYPGVACDVPAVFYSFSFAPNYGWTKFFPSGKEIVQYLHHTCERYAITDKIQLDTDVKGCRWLESEQVWEVYLGYMVPGVGDLSVKERNRIIEAKGEDSVYVGHETIRTKIVLSAVGALVEPREWPAEIPGKDSFKGPIFHSARWDYNVDLKDKDVIVVGTGCSAAQFVPRLTREHGARSVTQLMRSPPWVVPAASPPGGDVFWEKWSTHLLGMIPGLHRSLRTLIATGAEYDMRLFYMSKWGEKERKKVEKHLMHWMKETVPEKYHEILTPDYGVGCKRRIFDTAWFASLNDPKIELTTQPLTHVQEHSVTIGPGRTHPNPSLVDSKAPTEQREISADVIVLANGFDVTKWLHPLKVTGRDGKDLVDLMEERGGPQAYQGTAMDGFPNFFILFGPNTATGHSSVVMTSENMINYALKFIKPILNGDISTVEIKREAEINFTQDIQKSLKKRVWNVGCSNWYLDKATGWNSTVYPYTQIWFMLRCMFPVWSDWNLAYTRKGLLKLHARRGVRLLVLMALLLGAFRVRREGLHLANALPEAKRFAGVLLNNARQFLNAVRAAF